MSKAKRTRHTPAPRRIRPAADPARWSWRTDGLRAFAAFALTVLVFANSLGNGFAYDDLTAIQDNTRLEQPGDLGTFFGTSYWNDDHSKLYRPLTLWSWSIDRALGGPGPFPVHLGNVLGGALVSALVYGFLWLLCGRRELALAAALLFAVHPVHTEVLANGVGRSEIMSGVFLLLAGILHVAGIRRQRSGTLLRFYLPASACYMVALLFKESAAVFPALVLVAEWLFFRDGSVRRLLPRLPVYLLYAVPLGAYLAIRIQVVGRGLPAVQEVMANLAPADRTLHASRVLVEYLGQLLVPLRLQAEYADYRNPIAASLTHPLVALSLVVWILVGIAIYILGRRRQFTPLYGMLWFAIAILPASNIFFPIGTVRADRLLFLPSLGFTLVLAWGILELGRRSRSLGWAILALFLAGYSAQSIARNPDWDSNYTLFKADLEKNPGSAVSWALYADELRNQGRLDEALEAYGRATRLRDSISFYPEVHNNIAQVLTTQGNLAGAEREYRLVLSKDPRQFTALVNLGSMLVGSEVTRPEAILLLERAITVNPEDPAPRINLTQAYDLAGDYDRALATLDEAIRLHPERADLWDIRGIVLRKAGREEEAKDADARAAALR